MSEVAEFLDLAVRASHAAGALLLDRFGGPQAGLSAKSSRTDLVSDADRAAEELIVGMIRRERPDDGILAEEGAAADGATGMGWLVDPLDGTINYLWGVPHWSVSVAATDDEGDVVGVVHDPNRGETFTAARGAGARLDGTRLQLSPSSDPSEALVGTGFSYVAEQRARQATLLVDWLPNVRDVRRFGSAALDLAWVAAGRLDAFYETGLSTWDWAAGAMLVREAGGTVTQLPAEPGGADGILAARPGLTETLLCLVRAGSIH
jgi:myo-inositol-1(or 4)-monophosphatase